MIFGPSHYVPVLKVKRGEKNALQLVALDLRKEITPLLEIVEWSTARKRTLSSHLDTAFRGLSRSLREYPRCFLDPQELDSHGAAAANAVFDRATDIGLPFTPVTGLSRVTGPSAALMHGSHGLAIRLTRSEFEAGELSSRLRRFITDHTIDWGATDLIVDLGPVDDLVGAGITRLATQFLREIPEPSRWRTLILSASSFPMSMAVVHGDSHSVVARSDWTTWRDQIRRDQELPRLPTYSDCVIQHPSGVEGFDPRMMHVSATIRYALSDDWLLIKGVSTRKIPAGQQFPQLAKRLAYGHLRDDFYGPDHCQGCVSIKAAADGRPGLGSPEVWRRIGTVHHITVVAQELQSSGGAQGTAAPPP